MTMVIPKKWSELLSDEIKKPYIAELKDFIYDEVKSGKLVYPPLEDVFAALGHTPFEEVKVVIIGQDPYHGPNQAHGLCFSVQKGVRVPPSLQNIYKEIEADLGLPIPDHGHLISWADQGVLMLNATLTVRAHEPKSHHGRGWEQFTDAVVSALAKREKPIVFLLWGASAQAKGAQIAQIGPHHAVFQAAHPSPFSAHRFFGCKHFSKTNEKLKDWGESPIDWKIT